MCPHCRAFITSKDRTCPYCHEVVGPRAADRRDPGPILGGFIPHARFVTVMILLVNFGLFVATTVYSSKVGEGQALIAFGAKQSLLILRYHQWWRLLTAGFLHGGMLHILMNSWVLFDLGAQVEEVYGADRLIVIYFVSTIGGFLLSTYWSSALSVGSSAGIFGLIGAMIALGMRHRSALGDHIRGLYVRWAVYGLLFGLLPMFHIDNAAHIGGLAAGFGVAYVAGLPNIVTTGQERFWRMAAIACLALTAFCFLEMYLWFQFSAPA